MIKRREFFTIAGGVTTLALSAGVSAMPEDVASSVLSGEEQSELEVLRQSWFLKGGGDPATYLSQRLGGYHGAPSMDVALKELSVMDFEQGRVLSVKGLVLSEIDAATLLLATES